MGYELMKIRDKKISLSEEQSEFIELALDGGNILVDACIGSGKTTAIIQTKNGQIMAYQPNPGPCLFL